MEKWQRLEGQRKSVTGMKESDMAAMQNKRSGQKILSVIIPMYNAQKYIKKCLESLLLPQEMMDCIEVIVVDDGSADRGAEIAGIYKEKYPHSFVLIQQQNGGHGCAVDTGIAHCTGKYFKVLDADDWLSTEALARVVRKIAQMEVQVIACGYDLYRISSKTVVHRKTEPGDGKGEQGICLLSMRQLIQEWERYGLFFCLHGLIYHTDFYKKLAYRLPKKVSYDDAFFFTVPCSHANKLCILDEQLYVYRIGDAGQSVSVQNRELRIYQAESVIRAIIGTKERNAEKSIAGREYWYRKLVSVITDYYVTASLRFRDKAAGRKIAGTFTRELKELDSELYDRIKKRYWLFYIMSLFHRKEHDFERILECRDSWRRKRRQKVAVH